MSGGGGDLLIRMDAWGNIVILDPETMLPSAVQPPLTGFPLQGAPLGNKNPNLNNEPVQMQSQESLAAMAKNSLQEADKTSNAGQNISTPWLDPSLEHNDSTMAAFRSQLLGEAAGDEMTPNQQQNLSAVAQAAQAATGDDDSERPATFTTGEEVDTAMAEAEETHSNAAAALEVVNKAKQEIHGVSPLPAQQPVTPVKAVATPAKQMTVIPGTMPAQPTPKATLPAVANPGPAGSQSPTSDGDGTADGAPKRGKRELASSKRAAQNRAAQRAFRARKEAHIKELEQEVTQKTHLEEQNKLLQMEINHLRTYVISLQSRLIEARGEDAVPPMPAAVHASLGLGASLALASAPPQNPVVTPAAAPAPAVVADSGAAASDKRPREEDDGDVNPAKKAATAEEAK